MTSNTRPRLNGAQEEIRPGMECCRQQLETISICIAFTHPSNSPSERCKKVLWVWRDVRLRCPCQVFIARRSLLFPAICYPAWRQSKSQQWPEQQLRPGWKPQETSGTEWFEVIQQYKYWNLQKPSVPLCGNDTDYIQISSKASKTHEIKMHLAQALQQLQSKHFQATLQNIHSSQMFIDNSCCLCWSCWSYSCDATNRCAK